MVYLIKKKKKKKKNIKKISKKNKNKNDSNSKNETNGDGLFEVVKSTYNSDTDDHQDRKSIDNNQDNIEKNKKKKNVNFKNDNHILSDSNDDSSSFDSDDDDSDQKAQTLALGTLLLRKKQRLELINDSYNKYNWGKSEELNLPEWFQDDQQFYNTKPIPVSQKQIDHFKEKVKAINARPIKKILEARARKKMKAAKRWENLKRQSERIISSEGLDNNLKLRQIESLYKKRDKRTQKRDRVYMISTRGGNKIKAKSKTGGKGQIISVDRRMKSDKRGELRAKRRKKRGKFYKK